MNKVEHRPRQRCKLGQHVQIGSHSTDERFGQLILLAGWGLGSGVRVGLVSILLWVFWKLTIFYATASLKPVRCHNANLLSSMAAEEVVTTTTLPPKMVSWRLSCPGVMTTSDAAFYPSALRPEGYCRCLRPSVCLSVCPSVCPSVCLSVRMTMLVRAITRKIFFKFFRNLPGTFFG